MLPDHGSAEASRCSKRLCMFRGAPWLLLASLAQCGGTLLDSLHVVHTPVVLRLDRHHVPVQAGHLW